MKKFLTLTLLLLLIFMTYNYISYPNFENIKDNLKSEYKDFSNGDDSDKASYSNDVIFEHKTEFKFPQDKVVAAKVFESFCFFPKKLKEKEILFLLKKFNDSSSFKWGEIGTFIDNKTIIFYNADNKIIGITQVDEDFRQTYSVPMTKKMKWGYLKFKDQQDFNFFKEILD